MIRNHNETFVSLRLLKNILSFRAENLSLFRKYFHALSVAYVTLPKKSIFIPRIPLFIWILLTWQRLVCIYSYLVFDRLIKQAPLQQDHLFRLVCNRNCFTDEVPRVQFQSTLSRCLTVWKGLFLKLFFSWSFTFQAA